MVFMLIYFKFAKFVGETTSKKQRKHDDDKISNSFVSMPEDIVEMIFDLLDLSDRKSLAESCKRFNRFFSQPKYVDKLQLSIKLNDLSSKHNALTNEILAKSQRVYTNLVLDRYDKLVHLPTEILDSIIPKLKILKVEFSSKKFPLRNREFPEKILIDGNLPNIANFKHLEFESDGISSSFFDVIFKLRISPTLNVERVEFKHLEYLKIDIVLLEYLDDYYADFCTESLKELILYGCPYQPSDENEGKIRKLIAQQKVLKSLSMDVNVGFFQRKFDCLSKLKKLELTKHLEMTRKQGENFMEFYEHQLELEDLKINVELEQTSEEGTKRLRKLQRDRLDMKFKKMEICYDKNCGQHFYSTEKFMLLSKPNVHVKELKLNVNYGEEPEELSSFISLVATKFPNLGRLEIYYGCIYMSSWNLPSLENLKSLTRLRIQGFSCRLESITIPQLRCFEFGYSVYISGYNRDPIEQFIIRHTELRELKINYDIGTHSGRHKEETAIRFAQFFEFALRNSKKLSLITAEEGDYNYWKNHHIEEICDLMVKYARPEFHFHVTVGLDLLKRYDEKIVRKYDGRWRIQEKTSNVNDTVKI